MVDTFVECFEMMQRSQYLRVYRFLRSVVVWSCLSTGVITVFVRSEPDKAAARSTFPVQVQFGSVRLEKLEVCRLAYNISRYIIDPDEYSDPNKSDLHIVRWVADYVKWDCSLHGND